MPHYSNRNSFQINCHLFYKQNRAQCFIKRVCRMIRNNFSRLRYFFQIFQILRIFFFLHLCSGFICKILSNLTHRLAHRKRCSIICLLFLVLFGSQSLQGLSFDANKAFFQHPLIPHGMMRHINKYRSPYKIVFFQFFHPYLKIIHHRLCFSCKPAF